MDTYDAMFSASYVLNERIARQVFEVLPERAPVVAIIDRQGNCWPSDSEAFARVNLDEAVLHDLRAKVDDGVDPAVVQLGDVSVTAMQLATEQTNCGYVVIALSRSDPKAPAEADLLETLLSQITLVARLIEAHSLLTQARTEPYSAYRASASLVN
ncbi:MAG: hypothetical protein JW741_25640 [Sedimentisphaerales bacterium]|nr:hypothetical protein [Sedimentisphaerales bacterium]